MNPPSILLDHSFLMAVANPGDVNHEDTVARYRLMIDDFVEQRCLLVARAEHLTAVGGAELFAPVDTLHVARQHRNAAAELVARSGIAIDEAITLVLLRRYRIRKVASFNSRFANYDADLKVAIPANFVSATTLDASAATTFVPEVG